MKTLLFALGIVALVGCNTTFKPIGPFAKEVPITQQGQPIPTRPADATPPPALRPTPPTMLVVPGDVSADNAASVAQKFAAELEADRKPATNGPVTVEVSRPKR